MDKTKLIGTLVTVFAGLLVVGIIIARMPKKTSSPTPIQLSPTTTETVQGAATTATTTDNTNVKEFTVDGTNYAFSPSEIRVKKGDTVRIIFKDDEGQHNLIVDGYNLSTNLIGEGSQDTIQFVADKTGEFEYYCSVGSHRALGMSGKLIVE